MNTPTGHYRHRHNTARTKRDVCVGGGRGSRLCSLVGLRGAPLPLRPLLPAPPLRCVFVFAPPLKLRVTLAPEAIAATSARAGGSFLCRSSPLPPTPCVRTARTRQKSPLSLLAPQFAMREGRWVVGASRIWRSVVDTTSDLSVS